ncbi:hypothetical protein ACXZ9C_11690 [Streptococcus agalactiae]
MCGFRRRRRRCRSLVRGRGVGRSSSLVSLVASVQCALVSARRHRGVGQACVVMRW